MRHVIFAATASLALLAACSQADAPADNMPGGGSDVAPAPLTGEAVCAALLPALDGRTDGLAPYAASADILDALDMTEGQDPAEMDMSSSSFAETWSSEGGSCSFIMGDLEIRVALEDAPQGGQRAARVDAAMGADSGG